MKRAEYLYLAAGNAVNTADFLLRAYRDQTRCAHIILSGIETVHMIRERPDKGSRRVSSS
jgi:hypothetical protein